MHAALNDQSLIYQQIARMLEDGILRGIYPEGSQVPSTNELSRHFNINPATAAKGINLLVAEGMLYKRRGLGMFVSEGAAALVREKRRQAFYRDYIRPLTREARSLALNEEELAAMIRRAMEEGVEEV